MKTYLLPLVVTVGGCSGLLVIPQPTPPVKSCTLSSECGSGSVCDASLVCVVSDGGCTELNTDGDCPMGRLCISGACLCADANQCDCFPEPRGCAEPGDTWCECTEAQGCDTTGVCVDIVPDDACKPANPTGICLNGELCIGGYCVPIGPNACSDTVPNGWCEPGLTCIDARCIPITDQPCSTAAPEGLCASGLTCDPTSHQCVPVACATGVLGVCPIDQICTETGCEPIACSPLHLSGSCDADKYCNSVGDCIADGTCASAADCVSTDRCTATAGCVCGTPDTGVEPPRAECLEVNTCRVDSDCEVIQAQAFGQGYRCEAGDCVERLLCDADDDCFPDKFCSSQGNCLAVNKCDDSTDCPAAEPALSCSGSGDCIVAGTCNIDLDCLTPDTYCSATHACIADGTCGSALDCPPVHDCTDSLCVPGGQACTTNAQTHIGCAGGALYCCDSTSPSDCCPEGELCSSANNCIPVGQCVTAADCPSAGYTCLDYVCTRSTPCDACNVETEKCSSTQTCIPKDQCATVADCAVGETCDATWHCRPVPECGFESLALGALLPPNLLIVVDRSASMQLCGAGNPMAGCCGYCPGSPCDASTAPDYVRPTCVNGVDDGSDGSVGDCHLGANGENESRWTQAKAAINGVVAAQAGKANFGLVMFPNAAGTETCATNCNWYSCSDRSSNNAGTLRVPVGTGTQTAIANTLTGAVPGGATPTGQTLRGLYADLESAGLANPDTQSAILLVTDGEALGDTTPADQRVCAPPCTDLTQNGDESDVDCGGSCAPCIDGASCDRGDDCDSGVCRTGHCRAATCRNGTLDGSETAVDCGGACGPCPDAATCTTAADCASGRCVGLSCAIAACNDTIMNGTETGVDCGGSCVLKCDVGTTCTNDGDCASNVCQANKCRLATCNNSSKDGFESDTDCGGSDCAPCVDGQACTTNSDCDSGSCPAAPTRTCVRPQCADGIKNGAETDVDCGGGTCPDCSGGKVCGAGTDCLSSDCRVCTTNEAACKANHAMDQLYAADPKVKTYVVAFAFPETSDNLNCHAYHGRAYRRDICPDLTASNCADHDSVTCYYDTQNVSELTTALGNIVDQVRGCSFVLPPLSPDVDPAKIYVYLDWPDGTPGKPDMERINRYVDWTFNASSNRIDVSGPSCDVIKAGSASPLISFGCKTEG